MSETKSRTLTRDTVLKGRPCDTYRDLFAERFPISVEVTVELAESQSQDWDWIWAAQKLLTNDGYREFTERRAPLMREQSDSLKDLRELLRKAREEADTEYNKGVQELRGEFYAFIPGEQWDKLDAAYAEHVKLMETAFNAAWELTESRRTKGMAKIWAEIYISEEGKTPLAEETDNVYRCDCHSCRESW